MESKYRLNPMLLYISISTSAMLNIVCIILITVLCSYLRKKITDIDDKLEMLIIKSSTPTVTVFSIPYKSAEEFISNRNKTKYNDLAVRIKDANDLVDKYLKLGEISKYQRWALISFIVDMGKTTFINSYVFKRVLDKEYDLADDELRTWKSSDTDKKVLRAAEADLWEHRLK